MEKVLYLEGIAFAKAMKHGKRRFSGNGSLVWLERGGEGPRNNGARSHSEAY